MRFEFKLPDLAEGMVEGELAKWLVKPGDLLRAEQPVVEVTTDKASVVISSPRDGKVLELPHQPGDLVPVGKTLFVLEVEGTEVGTGGLRPPLPPAPDVGTGGLRPPAPPLLPAPAAAPPDVGTEGLRPPVPPLSPSPAAAVPRGPGRALATPATRRLARELGIDIGEVAGSGPAGRVMPEDLRAHAEGQNLGTEGLRHPSPPPPPPAAAPTEERVKLRGLRRVIYQTMSRSKSTAAHFTYVEEVECTNLVLARDRLRGAAEKAGVSLSYLPLIAKASLLALRHFPKLNASMDDAAEEIVLKRSYHLGIAAATESGLTVPVVRHADRLSLLDLARAITEVVEKARQGKLSPPEASGSTFTITSLGKLGGLLATPIINHPEVAILGVHKVEPRAVVRDGQIVARSMMNLSASFDHRVIDGHEGAAFVQRVKGYLEDPELMLLEMA
jgi:pyruvate dehydrogenase E2 component (dihydrolipoamide acetyltransferase)